MNGASSHRSGGEAHPSVYGDIPPFNFQEAEMRKFLVLAGIATALMVAAPVVVPVAAQADSYRSDHRSAHRDHRDVRRDHRDVRRDHRDARRHYREARRDYRHMKRHSFNHWRPGLERHHYRGFGRPVFHDHYYRVRAFDRYGRIVFLSVNAYTGVVISVGR
tara:strand:+ start:176215 stop:176700 length:486 start_codon:yes stop_codon:yes gene_type:complete